MRRWMLLLSLLLAGMQVPAGATQPAVPQRVLFVGNSLTYVGNLPATFAALANANGQHMHAGFDCLRRLIQGRSCMTGIHLCPSTQYMVQELRRRFLFMRVRKPPKSITNCTPWSQ